MADRSTHKKEAAVGAGATAAGLGVRPVAFGIYRSKQKGHEKKIAAARSYLDHGGAPMKERKGLNTEKKKAALRVLNEEPKKLKAIKPPQVANRTKAWLPLTAGGAALTWHGARNSVNKRDVTRRDVDAAAGGAAAGVLAHQGSGLGLTLHRMKQTQNHKQADRKKVTAYNKTAIPKGGMVTGDPRWKGYWRNYPKDVKGGKLARTLSQTHGGKRGAALLTGTAAAGAAGGVAMSRKKEVAKSANLNNQQIARRKRIQGGVSQATGALGLTALGGTLLATKKGGQATNAAFKAVGRTRPAALGPEKLKAKTAPILATSAGIGGLGSFNFASYTNAEAKKNKVKKNDEMAPLAGEVGIAKNYEDEISKIGEWKTIHQREHTQRRDRKAMRQSGAVAALGAAGVASGVSSRGDGPKYGAAKDVAGKINGLRRRKEFSNKDAAKQTAKLAGHTFKDLSGRGKAGVAAIGGAGAVGAGALGHHTYNQHKINQRRRANVKKAWEPSASNYDPEVRRQKRAGAYEKGAAALGITGGAVGTASFGSQLAGKGLERRANKQQAKGTELGAKAVDLKNRKKAYVSTRNEATKLGVKAMKNAKTAGKLKSVSTKTGVVAGTAGAGGFAANTALRRKRKESWASYSKSASTSAFGITHD